MPDLIVPPLLIGEDFAYDVFASVADAERYLEAWFPSAAPDYRAFDRRGLRLRLVADPPVVETRGLFGLIRTDTSHRSSLRVEAAERHPAGHDEMVDLLRRYLDRLSPPEQHASLALDELLQAAVRRSGYTV